MSPVALLLAVSLGAPRLQLAPEMLLGEDEPAPLQPDNPPPSYVPPPPVQPPPKIAIPPSALEMKPPPRKKDTGRTWTWVMLTLGLVAGGGGGGLGYWSKTILDGDIPIDGPNGTEHSITQVEADKADKLALGANVLFGVAAVMGVGTIIGLIVE